jgi:hypothetical protein
MVDLGGGECDHDYDKLRETTAKCKRILARKMTGATVFILLE